MRTFASFAILLCNDAVYMVQEKDGTWGFPGGGVEMGETIEKAMHRELREETDEQVQIPRMTCKEYLDISVQQNDSVAGLVFISDHLRKSCPTLTHLKNGETLQSKWVPLDLFPKMRLREPLRKMKHPLYREMKDLWKQHTEA